MITRRQFAQTALAALPAASAFARPKSSDFGGVEVGIIAPYAFRGTADDADVILDKIVKLGLHHVELQSPPAEKYAGAPQPPPRGPRGQEPTQAQLDARKAYGEAITEWRISAPMDKFVELRKKYDKAGVEIQIVKFGMGADTPDEELDYYFKVAKALKCRAITSEPPLSTVPRLAKFAEKHKIMLAFHGHSNMTDAEKFAAPASWEKAFTSSKYIGANIDIGHFTAGNSKSPADFITKYHDRIPAIHLKDRKVDQGPNMPWGEGDTQITEILQLIQREKWDIMPTIELEYPVPDGSNVMAELEKCVTYCKKALA